MPVTPLELARNRLRLAAFLVLGTSLLITWAIAGIDEAREDCAPEAAPARAQPVPPPPDEVAEELHRHEAFSNGYQAGWDASAARGAAGAG